MRLSRYYLPTLKEDPAEAEVISHRLLVRAGMIRKLTSGIYTFLPFGLKALDKVAGIIRQEMERAGCLEILMPYVQPADLWRETGRWDHYGQELLRLKDRHKRDYCLGPTHEEVITDLVRREVRSYRQLPLNLYQIQTKFRDEIRPRFGIMRCREFIMKDGYSFDKGEAESQKSYEDMFRAYCKIFENLGLRFRAVEADTGPIGGSFSHEFMVLAETGEDTIVVCSKCSYAANLEKAEVLPPKESNNKICPQRESISTPARHTVQKVAQFLKVPEHKVIKTLLYEADGRAVAALIPGDRELNELKLQNCLQASELHLASPEQIQKWTGAPVGFSGPVGLEVETIIADHNLQASTDWITGANESDAHLLHVDLKRDVGNLNYEDLALVTQEDPCPKCKAFLNFRKGIEVGHVFKLGTKYSRTMQATFLDESGRDREMHMGCYGIGVSRILAAAIEQNHDNDGIIFPPPVAPYEVVILVLNTNDQEVMSLAEEIYHQVQTLGIDVMLDDRDMRPGSKFKDGDLAGYPMQIIAGTKGIQRSVLEVKDRKKGIKNELSLKNFLREFADWRQDVWKGWGLEPKNIGLSEKHYQ